MLNMPILHVLCLLSLYYVYYACTVSTFSVLLYYNCYACIIPTMPVPCLLCLYYAYYACITPTMPVLCLLCLFITTVTWLLSQYMQQNASEIEQNNMPSTKFEKASNLMQVLFCMSTSINSRRDVVTCFMTHWVGPKCLIALRFLFFGSALY